jgi:hypothetical protein
MSNPFLMKVFNSRANLVENFSSLSLFEWAKLANVFKQLFSFNQFQNQIESGFSPNSLINSDDIWVV